VKRCLPIAVLMVTLAGCATESRISREGPSPLPEFAAERRVNERWSESVGSGVGKHVFRLSPRLEGGVLYAADREGVVSAWQAERGERLWRTDLDVPVTSATGGGDGLVLVGTRKGEVIALDAQDGRQRWRARVSSEVLAAPSARQGVVVVQAIDGKLFGLAAADGKRLWTHARNEPALSLHGTGSPVIERGYVFAGFASGKIVALRLNDGRLMWELAVSEPRGRNEIERLVDVDAPALLVGDSLYAAAYQGKIVAVELKSGRTSWSRDVSSHLAMAADRRNLYAVDEAGRVVALDLQAGASVWKQEGLRGRGLNAPTRIGDFVAVGDFEGYIHWLSAEDGRFVARHHLGGGPIRAETVASGDVLYVLNSAGEVTALSLESP
jgi:outer membrane protein assembly factor BamB